MSRFCLLFALILFLSGCDPQNITSPDDEVSNEPAYGDTIVMGSIGDASNLLPVLASDSSSSDINGLIYNGLVRYDKNFTIEGELAESWAISDDNRTLTFKLRPDVRWHDGTPFTSADVLFTYQLYVDPNTPTAYAEQYRLVKKAEAPDPLTFRVSYEEPLATALISWGVAIMPRHLLEGKDITQSPLSRAPVVCPDTCWRGRISPRAPCPARL